QYVKRTNKMQRITREIEIKEKLNITNETMAKIIGVSATAFGRWENHKIKPRKSSLEKVQKFIDDYENDNLDLPKEKQLPKNDIENIENVEKRQFYELIYKLEEDYDGHLRNVPDDDPVLQILRKEVGVI